MCESVTKFMFICMQVKTKEKNENISQTDAIFEVYADYIVERNNKDVNKALLWIFRIEVNQISEFCVCFYILYLLWSFVECMHVQINTYS